MEFIDIDEAQDSPLPRVSLKLLTLIDKVIQDGYFHLPAWQSSFREESCLDIRSTEQIYDPYSRRVLISRGGRTIRHLSVMMSAEHIGCRLLMGHLSNGQHALVRQEDLLCQVYANHLKWVSWLNRDCFRDDDYIVPLVDWGKDDSYSVYLAPAKLKEVLLKTRAFRSYIRKLFTAIKFESVDDLEWLLLGLPKFYKNLGRPLISFTEASKITMKITNEADCPHFHFLFSEVMEKIHAFVQKDLLKLKDRNESACRTVLNSLFSIADPLTKIWLISAKTDYDEEVVTIKSRVSLPPTWTGDLDAYISKVLHTKKFYFIKRLIIIHNDVIIYQCTR